VTRPVSHWAPMSHGMTCECHVIFTGDGVGRSQRFVSCRYCKGKVKKNDFEGRNF